MKSSQYKAIFALPLLLFGTVAAAQTAESTGRLEDPRVVISQIEEQSLEREKEVADTLSEEGSFMTANRQTGQILQSILEDDLETASRGILEGQQKKFQEYYLQQANFFEQQVEAAANDSSRAIRHLGKRPDIKKEDRVEQATHFASISGESTNEDLAEMRSRMEGLNQDASAYARQLVAVLPELAPELSSEWDPNQLVEVAMQSQLESLQYAYYARISRMNALLWEKFPTIVKRRALEGATGGRPKSTDEVISRGERLKIKLPETSKS